MLKIDERELARFEAKYAGITNQIQAADRCDVPACPHCGSSNTAHVYIGVIGRTMHIAVATTKVKLSTDGNCSGDCWCNDCETHFGDKPRITGGLWRPKDGSEESLQDVVRQMVAFVQGQRGDET